MIQEIKQVYQDSRKAHDIAWNIYVARPLAAIVVALFKRTPITPNQVTILGVVLFHGCVAALVFIPGWIGLAIAAIILQLAYILDCVDGQLARIKGMTSEIGAYFDFLIDEVKALLLVGACAARVYSETGDVLWLYVGIVGAAAVSIATSLTNFVRRPEYSGQEIKPGASAKQPKAPKGIVKKAIWILQRTASFLVHYPSWFTFVAIADLHPAIDGTRWFLYLFLGVYAVYISKTGLGVLLKLGSPSFYKPTNSDEE